MRKLLARMLGISQLERRVNELDWTVDRHEGEIAILRSRTKLSKPCSAVCMRMRTAIVTVSDGHSYRTRAEAGGVSA